MSTNQLVAAYKQKGDKKAAVQAHHAAIGAAGKSYWSLCSNPNCCKPESTQRCSKCKYVWYCGRECQVADWKSHKKMCKAMAAFRCPPAAPAPAAASPAEVEALREKLGVRYDTTEWAPLSKACGRGTWLCTACKVENVSLQDACVVCGAAKP